MGTAAVLDAKRKDKRRQDLQQQIEEVKADLEQLTHASQTSVVDLTSIPPPGNIHNRSSGVWGLHAWSHPQKQMRIADFLISLGDESTWERAQPHSRTMSEWWSELEMPDVGGDIAEQQTIDYDGLRSRLQAEESDFSIHHRIPLDMKSAAGSATHFIRDLLVEAGLENIPRSADKLRRMLSVSTASDSNPYDLKYLGETFNETLECVKDPEQRALRDWIAQNKIVYSLRERDAYTQVSHRMNEAIDWVLKYSPGAKDNASPDDMQRMVIEICHIIINSPCPPNVHTLSTLLVEFDRMGRHRLANAVIVQLLYRGHLEPTDQTIVCTLDHYRAVDDLKHFSAVIQRCTAVNPRKYSFPVKRVHRNDILADPGWMKWAKRNDVTAYSNSVHKRIWFSNAIMNSILNGLLHFGCIEQAVQLFTFCWQRSIRMGAEILNSMVDQCIYTLDEEASFQVLETVFKHPEYLLSGVGRSERAMFIGRLQHLLDLCGVDVSTAEVFSSAKPETKVALSVARRERAKNFHTLRLLKRVEASQSRIETLQAELDEHVALTHAMQKLGITFYTPEQEEYELYDERQAEMERLREIEAERFANEGGLSKSEIRRLAREARLARAEQRLAEERERLEMEAAEAAEEEARLADKQQGQASEKESQADGSRSTANEGPWQGAWSEPMPRTMSRARMPRADLDGGRHIEHPFFLQAQSHASSMA